MVIQGGKEFAVSVEGSRKRKIASSSSSSSSKKNLRVAPHSVSPSASPMTSPVPCSYPLKEEEEEEIEEIESDDFFAQSVGKKDWKNCGGNENEDDEDWENQLEELAKSHDDQLPIERKVQEELLSLAVREFNKRVLALKLAPQTVEHLKHIRRRRKNRLAAIRSRSKKEGKTSELQQQVDVLLSENKRQSNQIQSLLKRLAALEKAQGGKN